MNDLIMSKLGLRVIYIVAAFTTSHFVALLASPKALSLFQKMGMAVQVTDPLKFKSYITGILLIAGEFVYERIHTKFILPKVTPQPIQGAKS